MTATTLRGELKDYLNDDATLGELLTGGVLDATDLPQGNYGISNVPHEGRSSSRLPSFAGVAAPRRKIIGQTERRNLEIYLYQALGYDIIDPARRRIKAILNRVQLPADDAGIGMFSLGTRTRRFYAEELGGASGYLCRYYVDYTI